MMSYIFGLIPGVLFSTFFYFSDPSGINEILRNLGFLAFVYLCLSLLISPLANITKINSLRPYRKVFGVTAFFFGVFHSLKYFYDESVYNAGKIFILEHFYAGDVITGVIGLFIISLLGVTSLNYLHKNMGRYWQSLHSLVFPLFCIVALHIAFASRFDIKYMVFISLVVLARVIAYQKQTSSGVSISGKYICVPCGYVYDPIVGDPDSGIAPGTRFEDIPDGWSCPECGVSKADFIPFDDDLSAKQDAQVVKLKMLNTTTLELIIKIEKKVKVIPGQFAKIILSDAQGSFSRSYSVVNYSDGFITFCIRIGNGRSASILKSLKGGDVLGFEGIFGKFILEKTKNKKVFIATGTGLSPILNMLEHSESTADKELYFGVSTKKDLFYEERIKEVTLLDTYIFLSKEELKGYIFGRIDVSNKKFAPNTEFYICGNPLMVESTVSSLKEKGYKNIFTEKFN